MAPRYVRSSVCGWCLTGANKSQWGVVAAGIVIAFPVIWFRIKDTVTLEEDLQFSDETVQDVTVKDVDGAGPMESEKGAVA